MPLNRRGFRKSEFDRTMDTAAWIGARGDELAQQLHAMVGRSDCQRGTADDIVRRAFKTSVDRIRRLEMSPAHRVRELDRIEGALALCIALSKLGVRFPEPTWSELIVRYAVDRGRLRSVWLRRLLEFDMRRRRYRITLM